MKKTVNKKRRRRNDILKKKISKTCGGEIIRFSRNKDEKLENQFLEHVLAFETEYKKKKRIKIIDKIGNPHFEPLDRIPEGKIQERWLELYNYMYGKGIDLQVCSPNVKPADLYQFATEEL